MTSPRMTKKKEAEEYETAFTKVSAFGFIAHPALWRNRWAPLPLSSSPPNDELVLSSHRQAPAAPTLCRSSLHPIIVTTMITLM